MRRTVYQVVHTAVSKNSLVAGIDVPSLKQGISHDVDGPALLVHLISVPYESTAGVKTVDTVLRFFCSGTLFTFGAGQTGANDYMGLLALERNVGAEHLVLSVPPVALFDDWTPCIGADISNMTASDDDHLHFYCAQAHRVVFTCLSRSKGKQSH